MATGDPVLVITWFRNGTEVPSPGTPRYQLSSSRATLVVLGVEEGDEGIFRCVATNPVGTDQDTITLTVLGLWECVQCGCSVVWVCVQCVCSVVWVCVQCVCSVVWVGVQCVSSVVCVYMHV